MTYAAVASLSHTINLILNHHQDSISPRFQNQITSLHEHIIFLRSFLEESPNEARAWEARMRKVTNEAEDIIELLLSDSLLDSTVGSKFKRGKFELRYDFDGLERVSKEIELMAKGVRERHRESVGNLDGELMQIIDRLCGGPPELKVISIVGIGGMGKTTLARTAYNHPLIVKHFERRAWVTVSENCSWERVISGLLRSMGKGYVSEPETRRLKWAFKDLSNKRYLVVVDDLWSVEVWSRLESVITRTSKGSRIVITTRQLDVARCVRFCSSIHVMCSMDVDRSWNLLRQKVFKGDPCPPKLVCIGKMIAGSCRGVPLAVAVVSGILGADMTLAAWEDIAEDITTAIDYEEDEEHVARILHLGYTNLPHHLRPCFLYLGMFPEDEDIRVSKLLKLWVAEGFLNENEFRSFEESGEECLEDLASRSLISVSERKHFYGKIKSFSIHDLVREICTRQARADNFFLHVRRNLEPVEAIQLERRVSIFENNHHILQNVDASVIRTIICFVGNGKGSQQLLGYSRLLRILDSSNVRLSGELFELFHLRYLVFKSVSSISNAFKSVFRIPFDFMQVSYIPKAISKLENLQTLIMQRSMSIAKLPEEIWKMQQLRHLIVRYCVLPEAMSSALENLQTLTQVVDMDCSRVELEMIPNLKKLSVILMDMRYVKEHYEVQNLVHMQKLEILKIEAHSCQKMRPAFHPTLRKLSLKGVGIPWEDMKIVGWLPNLQVLKLRKEACVGIKWETDEGGFRELMFLEMDGLEVEYWFTRSSHFPRLKYLVLHNCWYLREIPNDVGEIPTLELIELDGNNKHPLRDSANRIQHQQQTLGNHSLQLRIL